MNFSVYTDAKNGNREYPRRRSTSSPQLDDVVRRAARVQAAAARRHHELRLLPRADSALRARRDARAVPVGNPHDSHRSRRPGEALSRFPDRFSLARFPELQTDRLQRVLLRVPRRSTGAAPAVAHPGRDGMSDATRDAALRQRLAGRHLRGPGARATRRARCRRRRFAPDVAVAVEGERIAAVEPLAELRARFPRATRDRLRAAAC